MNATACLNCPIGKYNEKRKQFHVLGVEMELFIVQMATVRIVFHVDLENMQ